VIGPLRFWHVARQAVRALARGAEMDAELDRELAFHLEQLTAEFVADGLSPGDARRAAQKEFGNPALVAEKCRDGRTVAWLRDLRQDLVYAARLLRRSPAFTAAAVASLALGIGTNTAIFAVADAVVRGPIPIPDSDRVVVARTFPRDQPHLETHATWSDFIAWRDQNQSFDRISAALGNQADFGADESGAPAEHIAGQAVTAELFEILGVQPFIGRPFAADDAQDGVPPSVVVISHRLWRQRFGADTGIVNRRVRIDGRSVAIVGVMPEGFQYPNNTVDYWAPLRMDAARPAGPQAYFVVTARLKPGVSPEQAQTDLNRIESQVDDAPYANDTRRTVRVRLVRDTMFGWTKEPLATLGAAVGLVLLVACANVAGLLLARGLSRRSEMAARIALGAGRRRIVRQLLAESLMLSLTSGVVGILIAFAGVRVLLATLPPPGALRILDAGLNWRMLALSGLLSIATGLAFGMAPALVGSRADLTEALKDSVPISARPLRPRLRSVLVAAQVAVTVILLVGSGLLMKSFVRLVSRDLHFETQNLLTFDVHIPLSQFMHRRGTVEGRPYFDIKPAPAVTMDQVFRRLAALPGIEAVGGSSYPLVNSVVLLWMTIDPAGGAQHDMSAAYFLVSPGFFTTMKATLLRGRDFTERDSLAAPWVAVVNESAARRMWPGEDPLGKQLTLSAVPDERPRLVIGVVRDIPTDMRQTNDTPAVYTPFLQQPDRYPLPGANQFGTMTFMMRTSRDPSSVVVAARDAVAAVDPDRPIANVITMDDSLGFFVSQRRVYVLALGALALTAMLLAGVGIYGVLAYSVSQRTREIGIRRALGAGRAEVAALVGRHAIVPLAGGLMVGVAGSLAFGRLLRSQLWTVEPRDPAVYAAALLLMLAACLLAACQPTRRATQVDPTIALRGD